ncbi:unnamed protein product [Orchesella dallaii]|uniref:Glyoxalase domain-containing protein 4 n=1 Tax=Orchesella dallaii TaxID=48710 RepID=A0ABP1S8L1_9HEXA
MPGCCGCGCLGSNKNSEKDPDLIQGRRALHYVFKIDDRQASLTFFKTVLGMEILRHDEFDQSCELPLPPGHSDDAELGPSNWSRTLVGYGPEDTNFVLDLIYKYGNKTSNSKSEVLSIEIMKNDIKPVLAAGGIMAEVIRDGVKGLTACVIEFDGYVFKVFECEGDDRIGRVVLAVNDVAKAEKFWMHTLGMSKVNESLFYEMRQCKIQFKAMPKWNADQVVGRIVFAAPEEQLPVIEEKVLKAKGTLLAEFANAKARASISVPKLALLAEMVNVKIPLTSLRMSNGCLVQVVMLKDLDGHEICFFGDQGYRLYSKPDPDAEQRLIEAIEEERKQA